MIVHTDLLVYWRTNKSNVHSYLSFGVIIKKENDLFHVTHGLGCFFSLLLQLFWHRIWWLMMTDTPSSKWFQPACPSPNWPTLKCVTRKRTASLFLKGVCWKCRENNCGALLKGSNWFYFFIIIIIISLWFTAVNQPICLLLPVRCQNQSSQEASDQNKEATTSWGVVSLHCDITKGSWLWQLRLCLSCHKVAFNQSSCN